MMVFHWFLSVWRLTPISLFACDFAESVPRLQPEHVLPIPKAQKNIKVSSKSDPKSSKIDGFPLVLQSDTDWPFCMPVRDVLRKTCPGCSQNTFCEIQHHAVHTPTRPLDAKPAQTAARIRFAEPKPIKSTTALGAKRAQAAARTRFVKYSTTPP